MNQNESSADQKMKKNSAASPHQLFSQTLRDLSARTWMKTMMHFANVSPMLIRLAALPLRHYKDKRKLRRYLGTQSYISPKAQISCDALQLGPKCLIDDFVTIYAHSKASGSVHFDENVHIYRWSIVELGEGAASLRVGRNTYIQPGCIINPFVSNIIIGANCMIAAHCSLTSYQHGFSDTSRSMREQPMTSKGDIIIEDDVWLGLNVSVMDGVTIGEGAIIGAGAVVTKNIPRYAIAGGVPARVLRTRETTNSV